MEKEKCGICEASADDGFSSCPLCGKEFHLCPTCGHFTVEHFNSENIKKSIDKVFKKLSALSADELKKEIDKHNNGEFAKLLIFGKAFNL